MSLRYGQNDRIHGYNEIYRNETDGSPFKSFELETKGTKKAPGKFLYAKVNVENAPETKVNDHQGHIVPQNMLGIVINEVGDAMLAVAQKEPQNLPKYLNTDPNDLKAYNPKLENIDLTWLIAVWNYGAACPDMLTQNPQDSEQAEFLVEEICSIVIWNPVNICRAPEDKNRGGYPKEQIDDEVKLYLIQHKANQPMPKNIDILGPLTVINETLDKVNEYLAACSATLSEQLIRGLGYYKFPWTNHKALPILLLAPEGIELHH